MVIQLEHAASSWDLESGWKGWRGVGQARRGGAGCERANAVACLLSRLACLQACVPSVHACVPPPPSGCVPPVQACVPPDQALRAFCSSVRPCASDAGLRAPCPEACVPQSQGCAPPVKACVQACMPPIHGCVPPIQRLRLLSLKTLAAHLTSLCRFCFLGANCWQQARKPLFPHNHKDPDRQVVACGCGH